MKVAFDLDLTLLDLRSATRESLHQVNQRTGAHIDVERVVGSLGIPFAESLAPEVEASEVRVMSRLFSAIFQTHLELVEVCPGARELLAQIVSQGGSSVIVSGRNPKGIERMLELTGLAEGVSRVYGRRVGLEKVEPLKVEQPIAFVGDHVLDMEAAQAAGVPGCGVTTGHHAASELLSAGAAVAVASLGEAGRWLAETGDDMRAGERSSPTDPGLLRTASSEDR